MILFRSAITSAAFALAYACAAQTTNLDQPPAAEVVMARVAANQDTAEAERAHYVYVQHAKMSSRRGKTVLCEEITDYRFTPSPDGTHQQLLKVDGRFLRDTKLRHLHCASSPRRKQAQRSDETKRKDETPRTKSKGRETEGQERKDPASIPKTTRPSIATSSKICAGT